MVMLVKDYDQVLGKEDLFVLNMKVEKMIWACMMILFLDSMAMVLKNSWKHVMDCEESNSALSNVSLDWHFDFDMVDKSLSHLLNMVVVSQTAAAFFFSSCKEQNTLKIW